MLPSWSPQRPLNGERQEVGGRNHRLLIVNMRTSSALEFFGVRKSCHPAQMPEPSFHTWWLRRAKESAYGGSADAKSAGNLPASACATRSPMDSISLHWNTRQPHRVEYYRALRPVYPRSWSVWLDIKVGNFSPRTARFQVACKVGNFWLQPILAGH